MVLVREARPKRQQQQQQLIITKLPAQVNIARSQCISARASERVEECSLCSYCCCCPIDCSRAPAANNSPDTRSKLAPFNCEQCELSWRANRALGCESEPRRSSKLGENCAKCHSLARWTSTQAIHRSREKEQQTKFKRTKPQMSSSQMCIKSIASEKSGCLECGGLRAKVAAKNKNKINASKSNHFQLEANKTNCDRKFDPREKTNFFCPRHNSVGESQKNKQRRNLKKSQDLLNNNNIRSREEEEEDDDDDDEISSLTSDDDSSINLRAERLASSELHLGKALKEEKEFGDDEKWSLSSCYEATKTKRRVEMVEQEMRKKEEKKASPPPPANINRAQLKLQPRPQVAPPARPKSRAPQAPSMKHPVNKPPISKQMLPETVKKCPKLQEEESREEKQCDNYSYLDSGNTSGAELTSHHSSSDHSSSLAAFNSRKVKVKDSPEKQGQQVSPTSPKPNLLTEAEVFSIEHFLKSHKSSIYVCGCMANLYLTSTQLVDNGRCSKPAAEGWQLSKTGVPVLTFDSGLTRNRDRRRLSINLTERGSGFVLWSDIIDHLSNYRAFSSQLHGWEERKETGAIKEEQQQTCDTFHVMYLSSNHRVMVGLSFDDAHCARLFLKQVELVTSDPANISLTGPKLARQLGASVGRFGRILSSSGGKALSSGATNHKLHQTKRTTSIAQLDNISSPQEQLKPTLLWASTNSVNYSTYSRSKREPEMGVSVICKEVEREKREEPAVKQQLSSREKARQWKLNKLIAASRQRTGEVSEGLSSSVDYTWSTLKRAIRFRGQMRWEQEKRAKEETPPMKVNRTGLSAPSPLYFEADEGLDAFKPKPLPSLAAAGKMFGGRSGKKMPRKCDISAPCLFQHVTRIDLSNLDRLYSKSLVVSPPVFASTDAPSCGQNVQLQPSCSSSSSNSPSSSDKTSRQLEIQLSATSNKPNHLTPACLISQQQQQQQLKRTEPTIGQTRSQVPPVSQGHTHSISAASSCYSSASISPASSECGAQRASFVSTPTTPQRQHLRRVQDQVISQPVPRPLPTLPAQRMESALLLSSGANLVLGADKLLTSTTNKSSSSLSPTTAGSQANCSGANKIQAIIRELQAQTCAELVEAKRKLMADIADQVLARAGSCSTSISNSSQSFQLPSSSLSASSVSRL